MVEQLRRWTTVDDVIAVARKRWTTGRYLADHASGVPFTPISLVIKAPQAGELLDRLAEATRWIEQFERQSRTAHGADRFVVEYKTIKGRTVGANLVPARVRIESLEMLCELLHTTADRVALDGVIAQTAEHCPDLLPWVCRHPLEAVAANEIWPTVLATVVWIAAHDTTNVYVRQIDVERVDTKFVEDNRRLIADLLAMVVPPERIDTAFPRHDLVGRFGFRRKPNYVRFRLLAPDARFGIGLSELALRADEFARCEPAASVVFIVENEVSYLAFPSVPDAIVVFGAGFAIDVVKALHWLDHKTVVYWGDIDTHGLSMLSRLRDRFPDVRSMLMDHETLGAHPQQWVTEVVPTTQTLPHLTEAELALYRDLIEDRYGKRVRLEQERIRFSLVRGALSPWTADPAG